jgi:hypothetical protein
MYYVFRLERATEFNQAGERVELVEEVAGRWRPKQGDILLLTEGSNLNLIFRLFVQVEKVAEDERPSIHSRAEGMRRIRISATLLAEGKNSLGQMMYSLQKISNFARPGLNVRHHGSVGEVDYQRVRNDDIHARRSLYYGTLQFLPAVWRSYLDLSARALHQRASLEERNSAAKDDEDPRWPLTSLLSIIDRSFLEPVTLAHRAATRRQELPMDLRGPFVEVTMSSNPGWVEKFLRWSWTNRAVLDDLRSNIGTLTRDTPEEDKEVQWRPHRW